MNRILYEYSTRKRMAKLGLTTSLKDVPAKKVAMFMVIEDEIEKIRARDSKKKPRGR